MNIIIVDDEKLAIDVLSMLLKRQVQFDIHIKGAFTNATDALLFLAKEPIDIMFLDIEMVDMHGLQVAKQLLKRQPSLQIIFVTAHAQFAVDAFEIEATDYLLKPVPEKRLIKALTKSQKKLDDAAMHQKIKAPYMYAHTLGSFYLLDTSQQVIKWRTKKVRELFIYLWIHQQKPVLNAVLIEELWPELELKKAVQNLHTSIYQLRKLLKENGCPDGLQLMNTHYQLKLEIRSDYEVLNQLLRQDKHTDESIQQLLDCYEDDFLADAEYPWAIQIQTHLKEKVIQTLQQYITNNGSVNAGLYYSCLQKLLDLDEYNEYYMGLLLEVFIQQDNKQKCTEYFKSIEAKLAEIEMPVPAKIQARFKDYMLKP
ncbi:response regulator [Paenibacillus senegalimassiliensis]|uniref:response regulator n=1 Tax=Paenibacillus senegalimassiliensis TaxID=1737426 RepID=UPI00073EF546|nr:response regulator [Paenibacillus senegalimassiliensis]